MVALTAAQTATPNPRNSESIVGEEEEEHKMKNPERLRAERQATNISPSFSSPVAEVFETDGTHPLFFLSKREEAHLPTHSKKATIEKFVVKNRRPVFLLSVEL